MRTLKLNQGLDSSLSAVLPAMPPFQGPFSGQRPQLESHQPRLLEAFQRLLDLSVSCNQQDTNFFNISRIQIS